MKIQKSIFFLSVILSFNFLKAAENQTGLTGDWNGARATLLKKGVRIDGLYVSDVLANITGGIRHRVNYLDIVELGFLVDPGKISGWQGATFFCDMTGSHGQDPGECVGDIQGVSNIAAQNVWRLSEGWFQQNFWNDRFSFLIGIYDLNTEFDVLESAGQFIHSSHGMGAGLAQSGKNGPSTFPCTALALRIKTRLSNQLTFQSAILDGVPEENRFGSGRMIRLSQEEGALISSELIFTGQSPKNRNAGIKRKNFHRRGRFGRARRFQNRRRFIKFRRRQRFKSPIRLKPEKSTKFVLGGWYYTARFESFESTLPATRNGSWGVYFLFEHAICRITETEPREFSYFFRAGHSDQVTNQIDGYVSGGIVFSGIFPGQTGLAVAFAHNSGKFKHKMRQCQNQSMENREFALELSWRTEFRNWFAIQPDLQYIVNPGFQPEVKNAIVAGFRVEISL